MLSRCVSHADSHRFRNYMYLLIGSPLPAQRHLQTNLQRALLSEITFIFGHRISLSSAMLVRSLLVGLGSASAYTMAPSRMAGSVHAQPRAAVAQLPTWNQRSSPAAHFRMQVQEDIKPEDIYDEFMGLDESGASVKLELDEKEKLYLECLDSFYNEGGKALLPDNKYEQLKVDLNLNPNPNPNPNPNLNP